MVEENDGAESGLPESAPDMSPTDADTFAAGLVMNGASRERADIFLEKQSRLIELQTEHLHEQREVQISRLRLSRVDEWLKVALKLMTAAAGVAIAAGLAAMMWNASHSNGLLIEPFSVPPDFSQRGLTGQVVASQILANLSAFQAQTLSARAPSSYANNWGNDIKLEIPETGVSVGEFNRLLQNWLGHETHISGAVYRGTAGITVMVGTGNGASETFTGKEGDLDQLLQSAAEAVYHSTQPYRYAVHLMGTRHMPEAEAAFETIAADSSAQERAWGYVGLADLYMFQTEYQKAAQTARSAIALRPDFLMAYLSLTDAEFLSEHDQGAMAAGEAALALGQPKNDPDISEQVWNIQRLNVETHLAGYRGDYGRQIELQGDLLKLPQLAGRHEDSRRSRMSAFAAMHDAASSNAERAELPLSHNPRINILRVAYEAVTDVQLGHWSTMLDERATLESGLTKLLPNAIPYKSLRLWPAESYALALSGDFAAAHALIDKTPADCVSCLRVRGRIDSLQKNWGGASYWFDRAARAAPSTPFPFADWGQMLFAKGDFDGAIAKFGIANEKGPHFADPLEMWGEALMAKNQSHLALAKFAQAGQYAPNWGHLHLKWGEALYYAGKTIAAKQQYARAAGLDLAAADKVELARMQAI